jgi:hypothetical protein
VLAKGLIVGLILAGGIMLSRGITRGLAEEGHATAPHQPTVQPLSPDQNLLRNGGLNGDYYWVYPNHYVAPEWRRWWIAGSDLPEYDRSRGTSQPYLEGDRSQRMHKRGGHFVAGLYQTVTGITPCVPYELSAWARMSALTGVVPGNRVALDPTGVELTSAPTSGAIPGFAAETAWSDALTRQNQWQKLSVVGEATRHTVTVILYVNPVRTVSNEVHWYDTYWDDAQLTRQSFPDNRLPAPATWSTSGFVSRPTTFIAGSDVVVSWQTPTPASTQVWYAIYPPTSPLTPTDAMTYTAYLPMVASSSSPSTYTTMTPLSETPTTSHQVTVPGVPADHTVVFVALSRRPDGNICTTEVSELMELSLTTNQLITLDASRASILLPEPIVPQP